LTPSEAAEGRRLLEAHKATGSLRDADRGRDWLWANREALVRCAEEAAKTESQGAPRCGYFPNGTAPCGAVATRRDRVSGRPFCTVHSVEGDEPQGAPRREGGNCSRCTVQSCAENYVDASGLCGHCKCDLHNLQGAPTSLVREARASARLDEETHCLPDEGAPKKSEQET
jgi:hypothetical protein